MDGLDFVMDGLDGYEFGGSYYHPYLRV